MAVLYAGETSRVAIAEYLFHDLPYGAGAVLPYSELLGKGSTRLVPRDDLKLARLHDDGLRRLGVRHSQLIDTPASTYAQTVRWARAVHAADPSVQGMQWMSRQYNSRLAVVLFGDRVDSCRLVPDPAWQDRDYSTGEGLDEVLEAADEAGVVLVVPAS